MRALLTLTFFALVSRIDSEPLNIFLKALSSCNPDIINCIQNKTVNLIERVAKEESLTIIKGSLFLVRDPSVNFTDSKPERRSIGDSITNLFDTHRIQFKLPKFTFFTKSQVEGRKKKGYGVGMMIGGVMMTLGMAAVAAMAGKALAASMAALLLAAMNAFRKGGGGGSHHASYEVISLPSHHQHRSFYDQDRPHKPYQYEHPYEHPPAYDN